MKMLKIRLLYVIRDCRNYNLHYKLLEKSSYLNYKTILGLKTKLLNKSIYTRWNIIYMCVCNYRD